MSNNTQASSGGIGLLGLTFVVLLALKLTGLAAISWWWVFSPLLISFGIVAVIITIAVFIGLKS